MSKNLISVISPLSNEDFFSQYFEKKFLHIARNSPDYFDHILNLKDIDELLATNRLHYPQINLTKKESPKGFPTWLVSPAKTQQTHLILKNELYQQVADGYTLILNSLQYHLPKLNQFVLKQGEEWGVTLSTNVYITPNESQGFQWHYDSHDVLIFQIKGSKTWEIIEEESFLPDQNYKAVSPKMKGEPKTTSILLQEGDTLYIPRGIYHCANTKSEYSIHATVSFYTHKAYEVFEELLKEAYSQKEFRRSIIPSYSTKEENEKILEIAKQFAIKYFEKVEKESSIEFRPILKNNNIKIHDDYNRLSSILELSSLNLNTRIQLSTKEIPRITLGKQFLTIHARSKDLKYPLFMKGLINSILNKEPIIIKDISGDAPEKQKLNLIRKFIIEGLIIIVK